MCYDLLKIVLHVSRDATMTTIESLIILLFGNSSWSSRVCECDNASYRILKNWRVSWGMMRLSRSSNKSGITNYRYVIFQSRDRSERFAWYFVRFQCRSRTPRWIRIYNYPSHPIPSTIYNSSADRYSRKFAQTFRSNSLMINVYNWKQKLYCR